MLFGIPLLLALLAFVSVIFIHELGHYLVGRLCGIGASAFSIGFGPKLISFVDRRNTEWMICLIPLGGYVKFLTSEGTPNTQSTPFNDEKSLGFVPQSTFENAPLLSRAVTVIAGPFANFLMAIIIFSYAAFINGTVSQKPVIGDVVNLPSQKDILMVGDRILSIDGKKIETFSQVYELAALVDKASRVNFRVLRSGKVIELPLPYLFQPVVFHVEMFSPAMRAGIEVGDVFLEINSKLVETFDDVKEVINSSDGKSLPTVLWRNGDVFLTTLIPEMRPTETHSGDLVEEMRIGVRGGPILSPETRPISILEAGYMGSRMTYYVVKTSLIGLVRIIDTSISPRHLSGPVGVAKALSYSASEGLLPFLSLLAAISAGIGLINLFPIPILDGGHLVLFLYESLFKSPPPGVLVRLLMMAGVGFLVTLMVFATFNDIVR